jgi:hypothetical protein
MSGAFKADHRAGTGTQPGPDHLVLYPFGPVGSLKHVVTRAEPGASANLALNRGMRMTGGASLADAKESVLHGEFRVHVDRDTASLRVVRGSS